MNQAYAMALLGIGLVLSNIVHAHIGIHSQGSFETGLMHPFSGLDHLLAMIAVGLWAVQAGGRNLLAAPAAFVAAMALGATIGTSGGYLPFAEAGIAFSVLALGALIAFSVRGAWQWTVPMIAAFALFHGYAHGTEMPEFSNAWSYFAGFLMATVVLHACGAAAAISLMKKANLVRAGGVAISFAGICLLLA